MASSSPKIRLGTRSSPLALWQANWTAAALKKAVPELTVELIPIKTTGDLRLDVNLAQIGGKGLFTKELEAALLAHQIDLAVHSMKDVPTICPTGLHLMTIGVREDPRDLLITRASATLETLPPQARVGTSSLRRVCQIRHQRPDVTCENLRGNVETRLRKLASGDFDAIVLAVAGVKRLGLQTPHSLPLDLIHAVGQGALAAQFREDDQSLKSWLQLLQDDSTEICVMAERAFLEVVEGGCQVPLGCEASLHEGTMRLKAFVADLAGIELIEKTAVVPAEDGIKAARRLAQSILDAGGKKILDAI